MSLASGEVRQDVVEPPKGQIKCRIPQRMPSARLKLQPNRPKPPTEVLRPKFEAVPAQQRFPIRNSARPRSNESRPKSANRVKDDLGIGRPVHTMPRSARPERDRLPISTKVWADKKHLAKKAAGAAKRSACATGGGPSVAPTLSHVELRILSIMGEGFGESQTEARVSAFPLDPPVRLDPARITPTLTSAVTPAHPFSQEQPSMSTETLEQELPMLNQQTFNSRRARPRVRRHLAADSARSRIVEVEEQRLIVETRRNELLNEIKVAIVDLSNLVREHISRNI